MKKLFYISFLLFGLTASSVSNAANLDSLLKVWEDRKVHDTVRLEVMQKVIFEGYATQGMLLLKVRPVNERKQWFFVGDEGSSSPTSGTKSKFFGTYRPLDKSIQSKI